MNVRRLVAAAALALLSGCHPKYVSSTRDDAATLALLREKGVANVDVMSFANAKECRTRFDLTPGGLKDKAEVKVPPGEDFTVLAFVFYGTQSCNVALTFQPKPRGSYAAVVKTSATGCGMAILRAEGKSWVPEESSRKRSWSRPFISDDEAQCRE